jgi:amino acid transporter
MGYGGAACKIECGGAVVRAPESDLIASGSVMPPWFGLLGLPDRGWADGEGDTARHARGWRMNAGLVALLAFAVTFAAAMAGLRLRDRLPEHHLDGESRDAVKLVMGLVATMSALVLSLLISVTQTAYRTQSDEIALLAANLVALDRVLLHYGRDAEPVRDLLRQGVGQELVKIMSPGGVTTKRLMPQGQENPLDPFHAALWQLHPGTDAQRLGLGRALELTVAIARTRMLVVEQQVSALPAPFLTVLIFWLAMLFLGFGLMTRLNPTVVTALLIGALSVGGAIFLILELDRPYDGLMRLSDAPLHSALAALQR